MKIPSDFITATGEIHDWDSLGQVAYVAHVDASSLGRAARWEAVAQAVRAAVLEECVRAIEETYSMASERRQMDIDIAAIRSLK